MITNWLCKIKIKKINKLIELNLRLIWLCNKIIKMREKVIIKPTNPIKRIKAIKVIIKAIKLIIKAIKLISKAIKLISKVIKVISKVIKVKKKQTK